MEEPCVFKISNLLGACIQDICQWEACFQTIWMMNVVKFCDFSWTDGKPISEGPLLMLLLGDLKFWGRSLLLVGWNINLWSFFLYLLFYFLYLMTSILNSFYCFLNFLHFAILYSCKKIQYITLLLSSYQISVKFFTLRDTP